MKISQQSKQQELNLEEQPSKRTDSSSEVIIASMLSESPTGQVRLMESILEWKNINRALTQVIRNKGAPGVDGMSVGELDKFILKHGMALRRGILEDTYRPKPARRKEIPKPDGGVRLLGIPCAIDRLVHQATAQILNDIWDHTFSENSFGFRPNRGAKHAIAKCQQYIKEGYRYTVDIDMSKFFDRVNHDRLMSRLATRIKDKRVLKLIRRFLVAGVMIDGLSQTSNEGTPQGSPVSPILSNIVLDELDKELERRGLRFVRYADDCAPRRYERRPMM